MIVLTVGHQIPLEATVDHLKESTALIPTSNGGKALVILDATTLPPAEFGYAEGQRLRSRKQAAKFLGVAVSTLERWDRTSIGPPCVRIGPRRVGIRWPD